MEQLDLGFKPIFFGPLVKVKQLPWQKLGLSYTASGYGAKIPTQHMVYGGGRWRRVYCRLHSNIGSLFIIVDGKQVACEVTP